MFPSLPLPFRLGAATLLLVAAFSPPAHGHSPTGSSWASGTVYFQMALGQAGRLLTDGNTSWDQAASPAATYWSQNAQRTNFVAVTNSAAPISRGDRVNSVAFASTFFGSSFGSNTLAICGWSRTGSTTIEADILFNNAMSWDSYRGNLRFGSGGRAIGEIRRVFLHEMGHAIGLNHPDQAGQKVSAVMNSVVSNTELLTADDEAGAHSLYGKPSSSPSPTPLPTPVPTPQPSATPNATPPATATVSLSVAPSNIRKGETATFRVTLSAPRPSSTTIGFYMNGSARSGSYYRLSASQFVVPAGQTSATVTLTALSGSKKVKTATMNLTAGSGYSLGSSKTSTASITR